MRRVIMPRGPHFAPHPWVERGREVRTGDVNSILPHYARQIGKIFNYISLNIELYYGVIRFCIGDVTLQHPLASKSKYICKLISYCFFNLWGSWTNFDIDI